jgi:hypothetical protein
LRWSVNRSGRSRKLFYDSVQQCIHTFPGLCAHLHDFGFLAAQDVDQIVLCPLHICFGQIDFVQSGQNFKIVVQRQIQIAHGLGFYSLRRIY